ncbi:hypothetical protein GCK32_016088 [Trichostrongylus colubriformis]|uniref:Uncharacterized protein n=1 Tax=Trichostrongylus colubriformis TaxID=6319 RepID=A0AAN8I8Y3_TRICO
MRFARPPPKLPQTKRPDTACRIEALPRSSLYPADRRVSVDDSGISSCDSRGNTPIYQRSPPEPFDHIHGIPCSAYVCDGCDWVPEELGNVFADAAAESCYVDGFTVHSPVQCSSRSMFVDCESSCHEAVVKMEEDIPAHCCKSECCGVDVVVFKMEDPISPTFPMPPLELCCSAMCRLPPIYPAESTNATISSTPPVHPIEEINATSSVIYSKRLENALSKDRGGLLEVPQRIEGILGRFEEPNKFSDMVVHS